MTSGLQAEKATAQYLRALGFIIREQNWKTRFCEIDIVAEKDRRIYFVEVKYRATANQGQGLDYITPAKLRQMRFAAEMWVQAEHWEGDYSLSAVEVSGPDFRITKFLSDCY